MFWRKKTETAAETRPAGGESGAGSKLIEEVKRVIDGFRPFIRADGGDIDFVGVDSKGIVRVRMKGACVGCPSSFMTLQMGIERHLMERFPQIRGVISV